MALVIDVLIVEVIEEVIITLVLKGSQTVPNILPLKPLLALSWLGLQFAQNTNRMQHQRAPEEIEIFTKNIWDPDKIIHRLTDCKQIVWIWSIWWLLPAASHCFIALSGAKIDFYLLWRILRASSPSSLGGDDLQSSSNCHQVTIGSQEGAVMILPAHENYVSISALPPPPLLLHWMVTRHPPPPQCHHERSQGSYLLTEESWHWHHHTDTGRKLRLFMRIISPGENGVSEDVTDWAGAGGRGKMPARSPLPPSGSSNTYFSLFNFHFQNNFETDSLCLVFIKFQWSMGAW